MVFALLLLLAKRLQPLDKKSKHEAWLNRVFSVVITLVAAGGVTVSSCSCCLVFVASASIASGCISTNFNILCFKHFYLGLPQTESFVPQQGRVQRNARLHVVHSSKPAFFNVSHILTGNLCVDTHTFRAQILSFVLSFIAHGIFKRFTNCNWTGLNFVDNRYSLYCYRLSRTYCCVMRLAGLGPSTARSLPGVVESH